MKQLLFTLLMFSIVSYGQQKQKDCIYDSTNISDDFIKKINQEKYVWDNISKEARIITKEGDFLYIKKWACETKGLVARVFVIGDYAQVDKDFLKWKEKILSQASQILENKDYLDLQKYLLDKSLTAKRIGTDLVFEVDSKTLKKFVVVISPLDKLVVIDYLLYN